MSKKDYILIAKSLNDSLTTLRANSDDSQADTMLMVTGCLMAIRELSLNLQADNPRFNQQKFLEACGYFA